MAGRTGRAEGVLVLIRGKEATGGGARRVGDRVCLRGSTCEGQHVIAGVGAAHPGQGGSQHQRRETASGQPRRCWHHLRSHLLRQTGGPRGRSPTLPFTFALAERFAAPPNFRVCCCVCLLLVLCPPPSLGSLPLGSQLCPLISESE